MPPRTQFGRGTSSLGELKLHAAGDTKIGTHRFTIMDHCILVTAFEPNDDGLNASQVVLESLGRNPTPSLRSVKARLEWMTLPGDTNALEGALYRKIADCRPDVCLLVGQAPGRSKVTFERVATNLRDFMVPDGRGNVESGTTIIHNGPAAYFSNVDVSDISRLLRESGIPSAPSNHAGNHLCNQALYLALHYAKTKSPHAMAAVFMHIPLLPEQVERRSAEQPTMQLSTLRDAVATAMLALDKLIDEEVTLP